MMFNVPFSVLRRAYTHAVDTENDNAHDTLTRRDYWLECVQQAVEDWQRAAQHLENASAAVAPARKREVLG